MDSYYRLYRQEPNWVIDAGRGSEQQTFDTVNVSAIGVAESGMAIVTFENAVLTTSGSTATLTQGT